MIHPEPALSYYIHEILESIARFADTDTLQRVLNRGDFCLQDAEEALSDYQTHEIVEKRNKIFKAVVEYTKVVFQRKLSDAKDGNEYGR